MNDQRTSFNDLLFIEVQNVMDRRRYAKHTNNVMQVEQFLI